MADKEYRLKFGEGIISGVVALALSGLSFNCLVHYY